MTFEEWGARPVCVFLFLQSHVHDCPSGLNRQQERDRRFSLPVGCSQGWPWPPRSTSLHSPPSLAGGALIESVPSTIVTLAEHVSWRTTYAVLAAILAAITIPAHALALRAPWPEAPPRPAEQADGSWPVARSRPFLMLAAAFTLNGFAICAVVIALVPLLTDRGATPTAAA